MFADGNRRGSPWHKLRKEDFSDVQFEGTSRVLVQFIRDLMRTDPAKRLTIEQVCSGSVVGRARDWMNSKRAEAAKEGRSVILGSALAEEERGFVQRVLGIREGMDTTD
jgi:mitosis inhibitor protein kinase SWE1